jgi:hypothetical protein
MIEKNPDYIIQYWVGLMDGDGSVQVNIWRKKGLQYRLVIKLRNDCEKRNISLLEKIQKTIGGGVKVEKSQKNVIWVENHKKKICEIISHFEKYPPLTSRLFFQLQFLKECMKKQDINWYLQNRNKKYKISPKPCTLLLKNENGYKRYKRWISGFIEAKGSFTCRSGSSKSQSFSISQKGEAVLLQQISQFFGAKTKARLYVNSKQKKLFKDKLFVEEEQGFYILEIYNKDVLQNLISHCTLYPFYGEKNKSFLLFSKNFIRDTKCRVVLPLWESFYSR